MKKTFLILLFLILFSHSIFAFDRSNIQLEYTMNELSGNLADSSGYSRTATSSNLQYGNEGISGNSIYFNGVNARANVGRHSIFNGNEFTISIWLKPNYNLDTAYRFFNADEADQTDTGLNQYVRAMVYLGKVHVYVGSNLHYMYIESTNTITNNSWNHIVITKNGTNSYSTLNMYVNGVSAASTSSGSHQALNKLLSTYIGVLDYDGAGYFMHYYKGYIDEVVVWSRKLGSAEVSSLYSEYLGSSLLANGEVCTLNDDCDSNKCRLGQGTTTKYCTDASNDCGQSGGNGYSSGSTVNNDICQVGGSWLCSGGYYRTGSTCSVVGYAYYSAANSDSRTSCPVNSNTVSTNSTNVSQCLGNAGYYNCQTGSCYITSSGYYSPELDNNQYQCTEGYFCPSGSSNSTATECGIGFYCPAGTSYKNACPALTTTTSTTSINSSACLGLAGYPCYNNNNDSCISGYCRRVPLDYFQSWPYSYYCADNSTACVWQIGTFWPKYLTYHNAPEGSKYGLNEPWSNCVRSVNCTAGEWHLYRSWCRPNPVLAGSFIDSDNEGLFTYNLKDLINEPIDFYAEYFTLNNNVSIFDGNCEIEFDDLNDTFEMSNNGSTHNFSRIYNSEGLHRYTVICNSSSYVELETTTLFMVLDYMPIYDNFKTSNDTTNFSVYNFTSISEVTDPILTNNEVRVKWFGAKNVSKVNFDLNLKTDTKFVGFNSSAVPDLNSSAEIILNGVNCAEFNSNQLFYTPVFYPTKQKVLQNGIVCPESVCSNVTCTDSQLIFNVTHFSGYAIGNANLTIDNNGPKYVGDNITFTATYQNISDSNPIEGAVCNITTNEHLSQGEFFETSPGVYQINLSFSSDGTFDYNITCGKVGSGFDTLTAEDTYTVYPESFFPSSIPELSDYALMLVIAMMIGVVIYRRKI